MISYSIQETSIVVCSQNASYLYESCLNCIIDAAASVILIQSIWVY